MTPPPWIPPMTDPGMVERVARALATQANLRWEHMPDLPPDIETKLTIGAKVQWRILARAALLAMRDRSREMTTKGETAFCRAYGDVSRMDRGEHIYPVGSSNIAKCWQAMIDAALSEEPVQTISVTLTA